MVIYGREEPEAQRGVWREG